MQKGKEDAIKMHGTRDNVFYEGSFIVVPIRAHLCAPKTLLARAEPSLHWIISSSLLMGQNTELVWPDLEIRP